ncbi:MAG: phosphorylase [Planctomycetes bacterium]|nr:phosphorylase [Planctomycetota bacterium]
MREDTARQSIVLEAGTLWEAALRRTEHALGRGALEQIPTEPLLIEDGGVRFMVRRVARLEAKRAARAEQSRLGVNPFLPCDADLFVADVSATHLCVLNKFNVFEHHLLIVTRVFEEQESPLTLRDFEALWACLAEFDALGFYNSGVVAGASQPHRHLQLVPLPLGGGEERLPIGALLAAGLPFLHGVLDLEGCSGRTPLQAGEVLLGCYRRLLAFLGEDAARPRPYNLLVTRERMLLVPRCREHFASMSINALGFAGSLLVRDAAELSAVRRAGPMAVLRHVAR